MDVIHRCCAAYIAFLTHSRVTVTKRCSVTLKDEEAEIEMTGSQIKQEAPETNTFKMAEIGADDQ